MTRVLGTVDGRRCLGGREPPESHGQGGQRRFSGGDSSRTQGEKSQPAKELGKAFGEKACRPVIGA